MFLFRLFVISCIYGIEVFGVSPVNIDIKVKKSTKRVEVKKTEEGNAIIYNLTPKNGYGFKTVIDSGNLICRYDDYDGCENVNVFYIKGINEPVTVGLISETRDGNASSTYTYYLQFYSTGWVMLPEYFFNLDVPKLIMNISNTHSIKEVPKFLNIDINKRESNDAIDVICTELDDKWNIHYVPKSGYYIVMVTANLEMIWKLDEDCKLPNDITIFISEDTTITLTLNDPDIKEPEIVKYKPYPGKTKHRVSGRDDADITKKANLISSNDVDDDEERDEQGVIEDTTEWTQGIQVSDEEMGKLAELQEQKPQDERIEKEKEEIEPEADLREAEGEVIEEGATPSGEDIEHEVEIEEIEEEEVILPDYYLGDYFKDLKPITLDIYNHETEGLEVKIKSYPKYSSTIHTCIPNKGYIINSLYDSQRRETVWRKYKHDKYAVAAIVYTRKTQLIVLFVIDVNPNKSKVLYYRNLPSFGWRERYRESLDQCYLDTIIKGEWRISEKVL